MYLPMTANIKESFCIKGELRVDEDLTVEGCVQGSIELGEWSGGFPRLLRVQASACPQRSLKAELRTLLGAFATETH